MMKAAVLFALVVASQSAAGVAINSQYRLAGDEQAMPVQAFDDGRNLYVQLRDPANPPAPVGPGGPVLYRIKGYYMVLPLMASVTLQAGAHQARITSDGARDVAPGVVSMTRPVEAIDVAPAPPAASPVAAPILAPEPVRGVIEVASNSGSSRTALFPSTPSTAVGGAVSNSEAGDARHFAAFAGRTLTLRADGSVAGAKAAQRAAEACRKAKAKCAIEYRGSAAGTITISEVVKQ